MNRFVIFLSEKSDFRKSQADGTAMGFWIIFTCITFFCLCFTPEPSAPPLSQSAIVNGLDVLVSDDFKPLHNKTVGIITNHTGIDREGRHIVDLFLQKKIRVTALFAPEHGLRGQSAAGEKIAAQRDAISGLPIYSLYDATRKPTPEMLRNLQALVFDMQDVGARFYTYISTMALALQAAAEADVEFYVLDRPNPIGGEVEGPVLAEEHRSFVGIHPIALRHGMTVGELAQMFLKERWIFPAQDSNNSALRPQTHWSKLRIIRMQHWRRRMLFLQTGLDWIAPSPNMTSPHTALLYPGMGLLEATNLSEGRGTLQPFEVVGAPWLNVASLIMELQNRVPGITFDSTRFTPVDIPGKAMNPKYERQQCRGLMLSVTDGARFATVRFGIALLCAVQKTHPQEFKIDKRGMARLSGTSWLAEMILSGHTPGEIWRKIEIEAGDFRRIRQKYLLYDD